MARHDVRWELTGIVEVRTHKEAEPYPCSFVVVCPDENLGAVWTAEQACHSSDVLDHPELSTLILPRWGPGSRRVGLYFGPLNSSGRMNGVQRER